MVLGTEWLSCWRKHHLNSCVVACYWHDKFFNSPTLQLQVLQKKMYLCGTVRVDRKHMPKNLKKETEIKRRDMDMTTANGITMSNRWILLYNFIQCSKNYFTYVLRIQAVFSDKLHVPRGSEENVIRDWPKVQTEILLENFLTMILQSTIIIIQAHSHSAVAIVRHTCLSAYIGRFW